MKQLQLPHHPVNSLNFSQQNLQGRSFRGQNLTGADFSGANIQGADFSGANLTRTNFTNTIAGLRPRHHKLIVLLSTLVAAIAGLGECLAASWMMNLIVSDNKLLKFGATDSHIYSVTAGIVVIEILTVLLTLTVRSGLGVALRIGGIHALAVGLPASAIMGILTGTKIIASNAGTGEAAVGVGGAMAIAIFLTMASTLLLALTITIQESYFWPSVTAIIGIILITIINIHGFIVPLMLIGMIVGATILFTLSLRIAHKSIANRPGFQSIRQLAIVLRSTLGTKFYGANLTKADFSHSHLKNTDLRQVNLTHTFWQNTQHLDFARVGQTILSNPIVRNLLVWGEGEKQSFIGMNLRGANLTHANLREANFSQADLSHALLQNADLQWVTFTQTQAIGTDFTGANLTGACGLATWNIDSTTQLEQVDCRWIYLLEQPKPNTDDRERRPSSGEFAPNAFTSLFQEVIDTIEFIFQDRLNPTVFNESIQRVQAENNLAQLELQSLENKRNGFTIATLRVSPDADKYLIHQQTTRFYEEALSLIQAQQETLQIQAQDIRTIYEKLDQLTKPVEIDQFVLLQINPGSFETGFSISIQIFRNEVGRAPISAQAKGELPPNITLAQTYQHWQSAYRRSLKASRLEVPSQVTNVSSNDFFQDCLQAKQDLIQAMTAWLDTAPFRPIERALQKHLDSNHPVRIILQTESPELRLLPWQIWRFCQDYPNAEIALSQRECHTKIPRPHQSSSKVKILAILGDSQGINLERDRAALEQLDAEVTFLIEPKRQELSEALWHQEWHILFFAGHSRSQPDFKTGKLWLNSTEHLSIAEIQYALSHAIQHGLQLAIFNSCDGLGLAHELADLQIPQIIIMRQPVPDSVAQTFLINFLKHFAQGKPFYQSVRAAREQLYDLEAQHPCATWLPTIIQNPTTLPPIWQDLHRNPSI